MIGSATARPLKPVALWSSLVVAAVLVVLWNGDPRMLDPTDISWITEDDPFAHVMGWEQFRASPLLQYPIAKNDGYGLELGSSVVYSDSIPVAALILRPLSPILPHPFQYLGWWAVLSVVLQGYWGIRLIRLRSDRLADALLGAAFFMVAPVLLNRIGWHAALTTQWMILCALWLYLASPEVGARRWALLLLLAVSVHAYLFVMIGGLWAAHLVKCRIARTLGWRGLGSVAGTLVAVVAWMHCLGYFIVGGGAAAGGPTSRFDLVNLVAGAWWTSLLPAVRRNPATWDGFAWDGFAYLGAGLMALLIASLVAVRVRRARRGAASEAIVPEAAAPVVSWVPLVVVACGLAAFAASNHVLFDGYQIFHYPWPRVSQPIMATFRAAGRMIWPTYYVLVIAILWFAIRTWQPRVLSWILGGALVLQVADLRGGAALMRSVWVREPGLAMPLHDPVWATIATRYHKLVSIPAFHGQPDHQTLSWFCARHGIGTNIGRFGRFSAKRRERGALGALDEMIGGTYDPDTAYYFPSPEIWKLAKLTASPRDLAVIADGHHLLLPGADPAGTAKPADDVTAPPLDTWLSFAADGAASGLLLDGWSWREAWGTWSDAKAAGFIVPVPHGHRGKLRVSIRWLGHVAPDGQQKVHISFDQTEFQVYFHADLAHQEDSFEVVPAHDWITARVRIRNPIAEDGRSLGLGLIAIRLSDPEAPSPAAVAVPPIPEKSQP
jgi:hypothetical protein